MSAYTTLTTQLVSTHHLQKALQDLGFHSVELHERDPQPLEGFFGAGGDLRAELIVRRRFIKGATSDIGFVRNSNGRLDALINDMDRQNFDSWLLRLHQRYAYHVVREQLAKQGFELADEAVDANQSIRLVLRRTV